MPARRSRSKGRLSESMDVARLEQIYEDLPGSGDDVEGGAFAMAATLVLRSARVITARVDEVVVPLGLTVPKFEILALLITAPGGEMSFADLKKAMYMHPATMGHTMRLLEGDGFAKRRPHDVDRRAYVAVITAKGKTVTRKGLDALHQIRFGCEGLTAATAKTISGKLADFG